MRLIKGLPEKRLVQRIQRFNRITCLGERALSFYLLDFHDRGLCKKLGCSSTVHFALMKLALPRKKTRELLRVARALEELTLIDAAFAEGRIAWSAVREITRVAVNDTEAEWLELAESNSLRCVERAVSRAKKGDLPPEDPYGLPKTRIKVTAELPVEDYAIWEAALSRLTATSGPDLDASSALVILAPILLLGHWFMQDPQFATLFAFPMLLAPGVIVPLLVSYNLLVVWRLLTRCRVTERGQVTEQK